MIEQLPRKLSNELLVYSRRKYTPLTVRALFDFGNAANRNHRTLLTAAQFLHNELPIRLAKMTVELENLPYGLHDMPSVKTIQGWYIQSFQEMLEFPHPVNDHGEAAFTDLLDRIKNRHATVVSTMARGIQELKRVRQTEEIGPEIQQFLDTFYLSRIGIRMLIGQHVSLHSHRDGWVGIIQEQCVPADVARDASREAGNICRLNYGEGPEIQIVGNTGLRFTYIPSHLHHMIIELLKNSLRAVVEFHGEGNTLPPVKVVIAEGREDVAVKISDEGGGIPRSGIDRIWTYLYTTARPPAPGSELQTDFDHMAGYGFGLPISRLYARYFGGDLQVISMEGYGTDAYLHLNRLGDAAEALPDTNGMLS